MPTAACDLCGRDALDFVYEPERSTRGLKVYLCRHCGLVQSLPRIDRTGKRHAAAVSGGADWGNVRYGKGFRTAGRRWTRWRRHADLRRAAGAAGCRLQSRQLRPAFLDAAPNADITAVEPDERYADICAGSAAHRTDPGAHRRHRAGRRRFDIVHSCHTIEHLAAPFAALKDHARVLKPGGLLVIDAPNIALIGGDDIVEEWFIDKHLYHFSHVTLTRMIEAAGFDDHRAARSGRRA